MLEYVEIVVYYMQLLELECSTNQDLLIMSLHMFLAHELP